MFIILTTDLKLEEENDGAAGKIDRGTGKSGKRQKTEDENAGEEDDKLVSIL